MELEFYGAAGGNVTGSCHILRFDGKMVLFDCGLMQGGKKLKEKNKEDFSFNSKEVDAMILSHAHIDHSGRIPLLVKRGFTGEIYTQNATVELCEVLLKDSAKLAGYDAKYQNKKIKKKGGNEPLVEPLYTEEDVNETLKHFVGHKYNEWFEVLPGLKVRLQDAGHILGSAIVEAKITENGITKKLVFSGDLGQFNTPILEDPSLIDDADVVLVESTYGNREHRERNKTIVEIGEVIKAAKAGKGNILIPAFSIGRTQEILYHFVEHFDDWGLKDWKIYLDSPMAIEASKIYWEFNHLHDSATKKLLGNFKDKIPLPNYERSVSAAESKELNKIESGAIFIAGSGMCSGGRIMHHLRYNLHKPQTHILIVGYQANGTLGRRLVNGEEKVKIHGDWIDVNANIHTVGGLSAHADCSDLTYWLKNIKGNPKIYLVHGEIESQQGLKEHLKQEINADVTCCLEAGEIVQL